MKKIFTFALFLLAGYSSFAQEERYPERGSDDFRTVFHRTQDEDLFITGFGGPQMVFTAIGNDFAHMMGGGGGILVNNIFFGGYGLGLTTPVYYMNSGTIGPEPGTHYKIEYGHGGLWAGFIIARKRPVHLSVSSQFGWGGISQVEYAYPDREPVSSQPVFVFTPIVELEMNFSHFFKVGIGGSTSLVRGNGITRTPYETTDFLKPSVYLTFKFGWFN